MSTPVSPWRWAYPRTKQHTLDHGVVICYSDAHYWPGEPRTPAFLALLSLCRALKPVMVIANGDLIDGPKISRHPRIAWARNPGVGAELIEVQARQCEIRDASPRARHRRTIGNHDIRFDNFLSQQATDYEGVPGLRLSDHLPDWQESWSVRINDDFVAKHRWKGGIHAAWNNVVSGGVSIATGHTHRLETRSFRGFTGPRRYGIEDGTLGLCPQDWPDEGGGPGEYGEDAPASHTSGFSVLTWHRGQLLPPESCSVENEVAYFRGCVVS